MNNDRPLGECRFGRRRQPRPKHWLNRSLFGLHLATAALALVVLYFAVWSPFQQRIAVIREIEARGGHVLYEQRGPEWLRNITGDHHVHGYAGNPKVGLLDRPYRVAFHNRHNGVTNDFLSRLQVFPHLRELTLSSSKVTDDGMVHLASLPSLERLSLIRVRVTGRGFGHLRRLKHLSGISLAFSPVRSQALEHLKQMPNLKWIGLHGCGRLTKDDVRAFIADRPDCRLTGLRTRNVDLEP